VVVDQEIMQHTQDQEDLVVEQEEDLE